MNRTRLFLAVPLVVVILALSPGAGDALDLPSFNRPGHHNGAVPQPNATITVTPFSTEGRDEVLSVRFDRDVAGPASLVIYTFHYPLYPEVAPEPDTWGHERQMAYVRDAQEGRAPLYEPDPNDPDVERILEVSTSETIDLTPAGEGTFTTSWKATHGRLYFKVVLDGELLAPVATMRVHCRHVDLRSIERLKESLDLLRLPVENGHEEVAVMLLDQVTDAYEVGHGLRYMLTHHGEETADLDLAVSRLGDSVAASRWDDALTSLDDVGAIVRDKEDLFLTFSIDREQEGIRVTLEDRFNDFPFAEDPDTEVYLKALPLRDRSKFHAMISARQQQPSTHDPSFHAAMAGFDREALLARAVRMERSDDGFVLGAGTSLPGDGPLGLIVVYGAGGSFFLTREIP